MSWMPRIASFVAVSLATASGSAAAQQPAAPPKEGACIIVAATAGLPRMAVLPFVADPADAEATTLADATADVLWHDLAFEREYAMLPLGASPVDVARSADGLLTGTVRRSAGALVVDVQMTEVATRRVLFSKTFTGADIPRRSADTKTAQTFDSGVR